MTLPLFLCGLHSVAGLNIFGIAGWLVFLSPLWLSYWLVGCCWLLYWALGVCCSIYSPALCSAGLSLFAPAFFARFCCFQSVDIGVFTLFLLCMPCCACFFWGWRRCRLLILRSVVHMVACLADQVWLAFHSKSSHISANRVESIPMRIASSSSRSI